MTRLLNTAGLVLGMIGVLLIFVWGPPQPTFTLGSAIEVEPANVLRDGETVAQHDAETIRLRRRYRQISQLGLIFIFFGFQTQIIALWLPPESGE